MDHNVEIVQFDTIKLEDLRFLILNRRNIEKLNL